MIFDTEVLIVGAGPTGLMLACQLLRFGVDFKIIDKQADRAHESRAFGIQAKSMEIFQNLGIVDEFLKTMIPISKINFFINGKQKLSLKSNQLDITATPFPSLFFLPQSETERILIEYIEKYHGSIVRQTRLESFHQIEEAVTAVLKKEGTGETQDIICRYIVGCDGAHSIVRSILNIPFAGADYVQNFFLADVSVQWDSPMESEFMLFFDETGLFLHAPLSKNLSRIIGVNFNSSMHDFTKPLTIEEIENLGKKITHRNVSISNPQWMTRFSLHHRTVYEYQKGRAFLAGDSAHIHSPVGGQGMNTGLQDATNLAWKLALVVRNNAPQELLNTYQLERQPVGEKLTHSTDRFFWAMTSPNKILMKFRPFFLSLALFLISKSRRIQRSMFWFMSELGIHYRQNNFISENNVGADAKFLAGPHAGYRAPDASFGNSSLFEIFKEKPFNVLIFQNSDNDNKWEELEKIYQNWMKFHWLLPSPETKIIFDRYNISNVGMYLIRPDGYIGFRACQLNLDEFSSYLSKFFRPKP